MTYTIVMQKQADKKLRSFPESERVRIAGKISMLGVNPDDVRLDVKSL